MKTEKMSQSLRKSGLCRHSNRSADSTGSLGLSSQSLRKSGLWRQSRIQPREREKGGEGRNPFVNQVFGVDANSNRSADSTGSLGSQSLRKSGLWRR